MTWFDRWVAWCHRDVDLRPLALVRILVPMCIFLDLIRSAQLGLYTTLWLPYEHGGFGSVQAAWWWMDDVFGVDLAGPIAWWVTILAMPLISAGIATRPAIVVGVISYAQLGHAFPPGDRGIDRILRITLLLLLFSAAHRCWALGPRLRGLAEQRMGPAWPADLLRWQLVLIYLAAGVAKLMRDPGWLPIVPRATLYRLFSDPMVGTLDPSFWWDHQLIFYLGGVFTIVLELAAVLIITRWCKWWALGGAFLHLGIFAVLHLGMFPWGMLALYPVLLKDWFIPRKSAL